jgi:hypothetical protein
MKSSIEVSTTGGGASGIKISKIRPIEAKPSDIITVEGSNFSAAKNLRVRFTRLDGTNADVPLTITDGSKASFVMPDGVGLGLKSMTIFQGGSTKVASLSLVTNTVDNNFPIWTGDATELCSITKFIDRNGDLQTGSKDCSAQSANVCATDGDVNCLVDGNTYKAAAIANISADKIKLGSTIAGVAGSLIAESHSNCDADGAIGCVAVPTYPAALVTGAASKILSGQILAGVPGNATYQGVAPDPWDVRVGTTINGITGKLKVNCRNRANLGVFDIDDGKSAVADSATSRFTIESHGYTNGTAVRLNYYSAPADLDNATIYYIKSIDSDSVELYGDVGLTTLKTFTTDGDNVTFHRWQSSPQSVDIWDTIDDFNGSNVGLPTSIVDDWLSNTDCGGIEVTAGDVNVWKDVTTTASGDPSSCTIDSTRCTMKDKITGLWWSKVLSGADWYTALRSCQSLNHNGQTDWRLPTQKEFWDAYNHGIRSAARSNWIDAGSMFGWFWSSTTHSELVYDAWGIVLANGGMLNYNKENMFSLVCVR